MAKKYEALKTSIHHLDKNTSDALQEILILIKNHTGHDFSLYKESTIGRRTKRRMYTHHFGNLDEYYNYLKDHPAEIEALFNDILINVTNFFRDSNAFDTFENKLSEVLDKKDNGDTVRIWVPGCSTGEEVYSIAMMVQKYMEISGKNMEVRIFGTDIDGNAISTARSAIYPSTISDDITQNYLHEFFTKKDNNYKIKKNIRDLTVFAIHDILMDPPFSRLDIISCRNLLIYMNKDAQNKILSTFIYALKQDGILFLGPSESISSFTKSFTTLDSKWKIYKHSTEI
jgi:Methylase of chemotaxis methyl-accepting proteins